MEEIFHFCCYRSLPSPPNPHFFSCPIPQIPTLSQNAPPRPRLLFPPKGLRLSPEPPISIPEMPSKTPKFPSLPPDPNSLFREKVLFLDSIGMDLFSLVNAHPPIVSASLDDLRSTVDFMHSMGFTPVDLRRICGMCPEVLTSKPSSLTPVFTFLLREVRVNGSDLRRVVNRRPRLLVSDVTTQLRPTLYFLQMLGITETAKCTALLSCSVEDKLLPRIEYLEKVGFSARDSRAIVRRFPQLFCYSIKENFEPKFKFLVGEMRRELKDLKEFPQYFSFSLPNRIGPRHRLCEEKGVFFPLPALLKPSDEEFNARLEVCVSSSPPLSRSPLWHESLDG